MSATLNPKRAEPQQTKCGNPSAAPVVLWKNFTVLRGLAMCLVVFAHSCLALRAYVFAHAGPVERHLFNGIAVPSHIGVSCFVFVSGYFMARWTTTWPLALSGAKSTLKKYVPWTVAVYIVSWLAGYRYALDDALFFGITGFDRPHWFLVLLVQLYVLAPLLAPWTKAHGTATAVTAAVWQVCCSAAFYLTYHSYSPQFQDIPRIINPGLVIFQIPPFMLGMLSAHHSDRVVSILPKKRLAVSVALVAVLLSVFVEQTILRQVYPTWTRHFAETATLKLATLVFLAWLLAKPSKNSRLWNLLGAIGTNSLGILLVHIYILQGAFILFWHLEILLGLTSRSRHEPPLWLFGHLLGPVLLSAIALAGSMLLIRITESVAGKRVKALVFG